MCLTLSRCEEWENKMRMVAMDEKDFGGAPCAVERDTCVLLPHGQCYSF